MFATGLSPPPPPSPPPRDESDLSWLTRLELPDLPVRWDDRVVRYLLFFRDDPSGHATFANLYRHSGRFRDTMRGILRRKSLPADLVFVSMVESGFDPTAHSPAGATGLWQFMPETAKIYGLSLDRWLDQRMNPGAATEAAATFFGDLHRRFGSWELALASFNMGYVGLSSVLRRYNTNDFWSLSRMEGTLPWETTLYVPKVLATAVVAHNLAAFGFGDIVSDAPVETDEVDVPPGTPLVVVAQAAGCTSKDIETLNPELRASRTPPPNEGTIVWPVRVPRGKGAAATLTLAKGHREQPSLERYVVRFGETLDRIAASRKTTAQKLMDLNGMAPGEAIRGGTLLFVPRSDAPVVGSEPASSAPRPSVVVPADVFAYPDRKRVFYRVLVGDTLKEIANALGVTADEVRRWNDLDPSARLQEGMTLQAYVAPDADLTRVVTADESEVHVLAVGSDEFYAGLEHDKRFKRLSVQAKAGETIEGIGKHFDVSARTMERVNRRSRTDVLKAGDPVVVYVPQAGAPSAWPSALPRPPSGSQAKNEPVPLGRLPPPPAPDRLP